MELHPEIKFKVYVISKLLNKWKFVLTEKIDEEGNWLSKLEEDQEWRRGVIPFFNNEIKRCQFTGFMDYKGREIYIGDITDNKEVVVMIDGCYKTTYHGDNHNGTTLTEKRTNYINIVGNIYENPELMGTVS